MSQTQQPLPSTSPALRNPALVRFDIAMARINAYIDLNRHGDNLSATTWAACVSALLDSVPTGSRAFYFACNR